MPYPFINHVAIVGGTHGNELTGVYLVKKFEAYPNIIQRSNFETSTLLANPKAIEVGRRYVETDLNRCFNPQDLQNNNLFKYEQLRAKEIAQQIRDKEIDFIIDLHSSTANMGLTIILTNNDPFLLQLAAYLSTLNPLVGNKFPTPVKILQYSSVDSPYLRTLCNLGLAIEVGPVAQGVLKAELFQQTEALISNILDYLELSNRGKTPPIPKTCILYRQREVIDYPRDEEGEIKAMIAPGLNDYEVLNPGSPIFLEFSGQVITYQGSSPVYPIFVGEAAYIEKGVAMGLTEQVKIEI